MIEKIKNKFNDKVEISKKNDRRYYAAVKKEDIKEVVRFIVKELGARLSIITGLDQKSGIEILYHLTLDKANMIISVRSFSRKPNPEFETITDILEGSNWIEREIHEMLGVNFAGHPNLKRLLLSDDWPKDVYPLRKDFKPEQKD